jgi:hypothetical protein
MSSRHAASGQLTSDGCLLIYIYIHEQKHVLEMCTLRFSISKLNLTDLLADGNLLLQSQSHFKDSALIFLVMQSCSCA